MQKDRFPRTQEELCRLLVTDKVQEFNGLHEMDFCLDGEYQFYANLWLVNLRGVNLEGVNFAGCHLAGMDLRGTNFQNANLKWTDLEGADLRGANIKGACLLGSRGFPRGISERAILRARYITSRI